MYKQKQETFNNNNNTQTETNINIESATNLIVRLQTYHAIKCSFSKNSSKEIGC